MIDAETNCLICDAGPLYASLNQQASSGEDGRNSDECGHHQQSAIKSMMSSEIPFVPDLILRLSRSRTTLIIQHANDFACTVYRLTII